MTDGAAVTSPVRAAAAPPATDLSVIVISHGHDAFLPSCLGSLERALPAGLETELVLVDNLGVTDLTALVPPFVRRVTLAVNPRRLGFAANVNHAVARSAGRYVLLLNPDTAFVRGSLADAIAFMDARPDVGVLGARLLNPDGTVQRSYRRVPTAPIFLARALGADRWRRRPAFYRHRLMDDVAITGPCAVDWVFGAFMLLRRASFEAVGGMDENFYLYYEDADLCYRLRTRGVRTWYFPAIEVMHHHQRDSASRPLGAHWRWHLRSAIRFFSKHRFLFRPALEREAP